MQTQTPCQCQSIIVYEPPLQPITDEDIERETHEEAQRLAANIHQLRLVVEECFCVIERGNPHLAQASEAVEASSQETALASVELDLGRVQVMPWTRILSYGILCGTVAFPVGVVVGEVLAVTLLGSCGGMLFAAAARTRTEKGCKTPRSSKS